MRITVLAAAYLEQTRLKDVRCDLVRWLCVSVVKRTATMKSQEVARRTDKCVVIVYMVCFIVSCPH